MLLPNDPYVKYLYLRIIMLVSIHNDPYVKKIIPFDLYVNIYTLWFLCEKFIPKEPYVKYLQQMIPM